MSKHPLSLLARTYHGMARRGQQLWLWARDWWVLLFIGAQVLVLAFSPSSYSHQVNRRVAAQVYRATVPGLRSFTLLMAIFNVVITRIMVSTANGYGLSGFALDAVVRTLVLELIPLTAAAFVALQYSVPGGNELHKLRRSREQSSQPDRRSRANDLLNKEVLPRVLGGVFAVLFLALLSGLISLVMAYLIIYGFNHWGLGPYTRAVGQLFNPATSLLFVVKTFLFALIVAVLPLGASMQNYPPHVSRTHIELQGLVRMLTLLLCVEVLALVGNYY